MRKLFPAKQLSKNTMDMCDGPILSQLIRFSLPLIIIGIVQLLFSVADMVVVGNFAADADKSLAAVGSTISLVSLITCLFTGISAGTNILCARYFGAKEYDELPKVVHTSVIMAVVVGAFLTAAGLLFVNPLLSWMHTPTDIIPLARIYLQIYLLNSIPLLLYNFCAAVQRSVGDTMRPMWILLGAGIINIVLKIIFVAGFKMDVAGVALATLITQTVSAALTLLCLIREDGPTKFRFSMLKCDRKALVDISRIGFPNGLRSTMFTLANVLIQGSINAYDVAVAGGTGVVVAGFSAASNVDNISIAIIDAVCIAILSFTSQNFGAYRFDRIKKAQKYGHLLMLCIVLPVSIITCVFAEPILSFFIGNASAETIAIGANRVWFVGGFAFIYGCARISGEGTRGFGITIMPMVTSLVCICGVRLIWMYTAFQVWYDIYVLSAAFSLSFVALFFVDTIYFWRIYKKKVKKYDALAKKSGYNIQEQKI